MSQPPDLPRSPDQIKAWVESLSSEQVMGLAESMARGAFGQALGLGGESPLDRRNPTIDLPDPPSEPVLLTVRVVLDETDPEVWRRLTIPGHLHLGQVHDALQQAMGWTESHLHRFRQGQSYDDPYFITEFDLSEGEEGTLETDARVDQVLREPGDLLTYEYDFGDGWTHTLILEGTQPSDATEASPAAYGLVCLAGERACPPEDVGGIGGYEEVAAWVRGGRDASHEFDNGLTTQEMTNWLPDGWDPDHFDLDEVNASLARLVPRDLDTALAELPPGLIQVIDRLPTLARFELDDWLATPGWDEPDDFTEAEATALTTPYRVLLDAVGAGLTLTGAGYLPPRVVREVFTGARMTEDWPGAGNREDLTPPVGDLRDRARRYGLVRKVKGHLLPTANGRRLHRDPQALLELVLTRLAQEGDEFDQVATAFRLVALAGGHRLGDRLTSTSGGDIDPIVTMMSVAGWRDGNGNPLEDHHLFVATWETRAAIREMVRCVDIGPEARADLTRRVARAVLRRMD